ncbi:DUF2059 domain-containing protein [Sphingomonas endophytica]|uniref:DUF2059 domain-containing protein n=1 Tax=Sphingomonas endophytica TaxID=869719 RepID=A0A147I7K0_9SPHN|nr:DUF2059 domain-containing protein [Sphingomonas endophytica]KTT74992.1 hypothetical protein NS334_03820 [Sphingomonas endophytica]
MMRILLAAAIALSPAAAIAQTPASAPATAVDPARLAAATELLDVLFPPATRVQMMDGMMAPLMINLRQGFMQNPQFAAEMTKNPKVKAAFDRFVDAQFGRSMEMIRTSLPGMFDAIARAYARRFDVAQMGEVERFFRTPTGKTYMQASLTIMADPDVAAFQRKMMADAMTRTQADTAAFVKEVAAIQQSEKK